MGINPISEEQQGTYKIAVQVERREDLWFQIQVTPAYCLACEKQIEGFYSYTGGRYGQVGSVKCPVCGSTMFVTDNDGGSDELYMALGQYRNPYLFDTKKFDAEVPVLHLRLDKLYRLDGSVFQEVQRRVGYNVYANPQGKWVEIGVIVEEICHLLGVEPEDLPEEPITTDERFPHLPLEINRWLHLLKWIGVPDKLPDRPLPLPRVLYEALPQRAAVPRQGELTRPLLHPQPVPESPQNRLAPGRETVPKRRAWKWWQIVGALFVILILIGAVREITMPPEQVVEDVMQRVVFEEARHVELAAEDLAKIRSYYEDAEEQPSLFPFYTVKEPHIVDDLATVPIAFEILDPNDLDNWTVLHEGLIEFTMERKGLRWQVTAVEQIKAFR